MNSINQAAKIEKLSGFLQDGTIKGEYQFASSLVSQYAKKGKLSDKQWPYVDKLVDRYSKPKPKKTQRFVPGVHAAFSTVTKGYNPKVYIADVDNQFTLALKHAAHNGKNAGCLYVFYTDGVVAKKGLYAGKITAGDEVFFAGSFVQYPELQTAMQALLEGFGEDPVDVLKTTGHATGCCANCGKKLTHPNSVAFGIGPTCAAHMGLKEQWDAAA